MTVSILMFNCLLVHRVVQMSVLCVSVLLLPTAFTRVRVFVIVFSSYSHIFYLRFHIEIVLFRETHTNKNPIVIHFTNQRTERMIFFCLLLCVWCTLTLKKAYTNLWFPLFFAFSFSTCNRFESWFSFASFSSVILGMAVDGCLSDFWLLLLCCCFTSSAFAFSLSRHSWFLAAIIFCCINVNFRSNHIYYSHRYISIRVWMFLLLFFEWRADANKIKGERERKKEQENTTAERKKKKKNHKCRKPQFLFSVFFVFLFCFHSILFLSTFRSFFCFVFFSSFFLFSRFASLFIRLLFTSCST